MGNYFTGVKQKKQKNAGVTLVELAVVVTIFASIMIVLSNIFIASINQQKNIFKNQEISNQGIIAIENMARLLTMAVNDVSGSCLGGSYAGDDYRLTHYDAASGFYQGIKFISSYDDQCHEFFLDTDGALKSKYQETTDQLLSSTQQNPFTISYVRFILNGDKNIVVSTPGNTKQPRVTVALKMLTNTASNQKETVFQTTVSKRDFKRVSN